MTIELLSIRNRASELTNSPTQVNQPVFFGADDSLQVLEPRALPSRWTRFKAALVNVPFIGGLQSVRAAGQEVLFVQNYRTAVARSAEFRGEFWDQLSRTFGEGIASAAIASIERVASQGKGPQQHNQPPPSVLSARMVRDGVGFGLEAARNHRELNDSFVAEGLTDTFSRKYVAMRSLAQHENHLSSYLREKEIDSAHEGLANVENDLRRLHVDPQSLVPLVEMYEKQLTGEHSPAEMRRIAKNCLFAVRQVYIDAQNANTITRTMPPELADESSRASRAAADPSGSSSSASPMALSPEGKLVSALCGHQVTPDVPVLSEKDAAEGWKALLRVRSALIEEFAPLEMAETQIDTIRHTLAGSNLFSLEDPARAGSSKPIATAGDTLARKERVLLEAARHASITALIKQRLGLNSAGNPGTAVANASSSSETPGDPDASFETSEDPMYRLVVRAIVGGKVEPHIDKLHQQLQCENKAPIIVERTCEAVREKAMTAVADHREALTRIEQSPTLNSEQKRLLLEYGNGVRNAKGVLVPHRLDSAQVEGYEAIAAAYAGCIVDIAEAIEINDPARIFDAVQRVVDCAAPTRLATLQHADRLWLTDETYGSDGSLTPNDLCIKLAFAKLNYSPEDCSRLAQTLDPTPRASGETSEERPPAVLQFQIAVPQSPYPKLAMGYPATLDEFRAVAEKVAHPPALDADKSEAPAMDADQPEHAVEEMEIPPYYACVPELLVRTLIGPANAASDSAGLNAEAPVDEEGVAAGNSNENAGGQQALEEQVDCDARGVVTPQGLADVRSPAFTMVSPDFRAAAVLNPAHHAATFTAATDSPDSWNRMLRRLAGTRVLIGGKRHEFLAELDRPGASSEPSAGARAAEAFRQPFGTHSYALLQSAAIASCMAAPVLENYVRDVNRAAFHSPVEIDFQQPLHEAWQDRDGAWLVRSTLVGHPTSQSGKPIKSDGVILYTLTHRVTADPTVTLQQEDARAVFAF